VALRGVKQLSSSRNSDSNGSMSKVVVSFQLRA
jgi:hypothetical protein